ncbi:hypothetical protein H1P_50049 [Hyella patelloides LEGE 07179]|uniref:Uncharacterized protein n=1 Tax=Hyella patelloides LEGE 07179 TaxID=945734 RepID=A0A563VZG4_9CYAN|nr:hypothetical protein H1P_50049 [Hyella patelloides LEGE 07179]
MVTIDDCTWRIRSKWTKEESQLGASNSEESCCFDWETWLILIPLNLVSLVT